MVCWGTANRLGDRVCCGRDKSKMTQTRWFHHGSIMVPSWMILSCKRGCHERSGVICAWHKEAQAGKGRCVTRPLKSELKAQNVELKA